MPIFCMNSNYAIYYKKFNHIFDRRDLNTYAVPKTHQQKILAIFLHDELLYY